MPKSHSPPYNKIASSLFFMLTLILITGCGGSGGSKINEQTNLTTPPPKTVSFSTGNRSVVYQTSVNQQEKSILIDSPNSALNGMVFSIPPATLSDNEQFSISSDNGLVSPNAGAYSGKTFVIETEKTHVFKLPLLVDIPSDQFTGTPLLYYVNKETTLELVRPEKLDSNSNFHRYNIYQPGTYTIIEYNNNSKRSAKPAVQKSPVSVKFNPPEDGFQIDNIGSLVNKDGECLGMTAFARWYSLNYKKQAAKNEGLYGRFMCTVLKPDSNGNDYLLTGQNLIATRSFVSISQLWNEFIQNENKNNLYNTSFELIYDVLQDTGKPVFIYLSGGKDYAHSVLALSAYPEAGLVDIYDPNYHGETKQLQFIGAENNRVFQPYDGFTEVSIEGSDHPLIESFESIIVDAEGQFGGNGYQSGTDCPTYSGTTQAIVRMLSHQNSETSNNRIITLTGDVDSNEVLVERVTAMVNSTKYGPENLIPGAFGFDTFSIPVVLNSGVNHIQMIAEGRNQKGEYTTVDSVIHSKYKKTSSSNEFIYKYTPDFIINTDFETAIANVSLVWDKDADLDLVIIDPNGDYSDYSHKIMQSGGTLNREDDSIGPENWTLKKSDTVIYGKPYKIRAHYWDSNEATTPAVILNTTLNLYEGTQHEQQVPFRNTVLYANSNNNLHTATGADWVDIAEFTLNDFSTPQPVVTTFGKQTSDICPASISNFDLNSPELYNYYSFHIINDIAEGALSSGFHTSCIYTNTKGFSNGFSIYTDYASDLTKYDYQCSGNPSDINFEEVSSGHYVMSSNKRTVLLSYSTYSNNFDANQLRLFMEPILKKLETEYTGQPCP